MPAQPTAWTVEMVRALPDDGNRYEVIDGELFVTLSPSLVHQRAIIELLDLVRPYVKTHDIGEALVSPADVVVYGPRKFVQPDLFVLPLLEGARIQGWSQVGRLLLTVEVISPSTSRVDRREKRDLYREKAVPDYWIVDADERMVERWRPNDTFPAVFTDTLTWQPDPGSPALVIDLPAYFRSVHGD